LKRDVVVIGLLNIDMIIRGTAPLVIDDLLTWTGESQIDCLVAGSVGYLIQNLARLRIKTGVIATIADDPFGIMIKQTMTEAEIDLSRLRVQKGTRSAIGVFMLLFGSKKRPMTFRFMTHDLIPQFSEEDLDFIIDSRLLHIGGYLHFPQKKVFENLIQEVAGHGVHVSIDTQFPLTPVARPWLDVMPHNLDQVDILLMDENEAYGLTNTATVEAAATKLLGTGVKIVAIKLGAEGCFVCDKNQQLRKSAIEVETIVDSIGAGDSFDCGFITGFLEGLSLEETADLALKVASHSLQGVGGSSAIPNRAQLRLK
jgi:sugar/nucleoside kinase (ribokinase family)